MGGDQEGTCPIHLGAILLMTMLITFLCLTQLEQHDKLVSDVIRCVDKQHIEEQRLVVVHTTESHGLSINRQVSTT